MRNVTVACSCGRTMGLDAISGAGAYRCGCGVRVTISEKARKPACLGGTADRACEFAASKDSDGVGIPLCADHLASFNAFRETVEDGERWGELMKDAWEDSRRALKEGLASRQAWEGDYLAARRKLYETQSVVYYVRIGDAIKIGVTTNMKARMPQVMPDEVLATEPGDINLERQRQAQFAHLKLRGERFLPGDDLIRHIAEIKRQHGEPKMTGYLLTDSHKHRLGGAL
ncbi:hypothetical protein [Nonomuraea typhae]|uniref:hypothetical protein n=1 Tax=Nonomuraea typhae TaxID=2603600 RepID=UPI0012FCFF28|nr:hypothetical protein [Nonomuraea typhae]